MSSKLNERLQIAAAISIVVSLLLVGVQLRQNSDLLKTQLLYEESRRTMNIEALYAGENAAEVWAKSINDPANMTLAEQRVVEALLWSFVEQWRATRMLAELGLLQDDEWQSRIETEVSFLFGNRYGRAWWTAFAVDTTTSLPADLVDVVNESLEAGDLDYTSIYFQRIMNEVGNQAGVTKTTSE